MTDLASTYPRPTHNEALQDGISQAISQVRSEQHPLAEAIAKIQINHAESISKQEIKDKAREEEMKEHATKTEPNSAAVKKKSRRTTTKAPGSKDFRLGQRSKVQRNSCIVPRLKNIEEPLIGLEHLTEVQDEDTSLPVRATCRLCEVYFPSDNDMQILQHLTGYKHRLNYLKANLDKLVDPLRDEEINNLDGVESMKKTEVAAILAKLAKVMEDKYGRQLKKVDVYVVANYAYRKARQMQQHSMHGMPYDSMNNGGGYMHAGPDMNPYNSNYDNHYRHGIDTNGPPTFSQVLPLLYRCEIQSQEEAAQALQVANAINQRVLEFNATSLSAGSSHAGKAHGSLQNNGYGGYGYSGYNMDMNNSGYDTSQNYQLYGSASQGYNFQGFGDRLSESQQNKPKGGWSRGKAHVAYRS